MAYIYSSENQKTNSFFISGSCNSVSFISAYFKTNYNLKTGLPEETELCLHNGSAVRTLLTPAVRKMLTGLKTFRDEFNPAKPSNCEHHINPRLCLKVIVIKKSNDRQNLLLCLHAATGIYRFCLFKNDEVGVKNFITEIDLLIKWLEDNLENINENGVYDGNKTVTNRAIGIVSNSGGFTFTNEIIALGAGGHSSMVHHLTKSERTTRHHLSGPTARLIWENPSFTHGLLEGLTMLDNHLTKLRSKVPADFSQMIYFGDDFEASYIRFSGISGDNPSRFAMKINKGDAIFDSSIVGVYSHEAIKELKRTLESHMH